MGRMKYIVPVLLCLIYGTDGQSRVDPLVETNIGLIRGLTATDGDYSMFLGIPYARVNESNPFGPSIPIERFDSTLNAYDDSVICPQRSELDNSLIGTLDCLQLNVYVPFTATSRNPLPVLVWIYGGGYVDGSGSRFNHDPKFLVRHDVIVVTLNYRLGAYGWMCLDIPEVPGNQGLKDQLTALRWVRNNIEAFGGDASRITIFGESAGAVSVDLHLYYSQENLFNNVIIQSGTALSFFAIAENDPDVPLRLAERLGHVTDDVYNALEFLRTVETDLIVAATSEIEFTIRPCVEREFENVERYIPTHPSETDLPNARTKAIMIGFNSNEYGINFSGADNSNAFSILETTIDSDNEYFPELADYVRNFYVGEENILNEDMDQQLSNFRSDLVYGHPTHRSILKYFDNGANSVYNYLFSYNGNRNAMMVKVNATASGAVHTDELGYLFDMYVFTEEPSAEDQLMIDRMTTMWTNFAKHSNPTPEVNDLFLVQWPAVTREARNCLIIDTDFSVQRRPFHDRLAFWDVFYRLHDALLEANQTAIPYSG